MMKHPRNVQACASAGTSRAHGTIFLPCPTSWKFNSDDFCIKYIFCSTSRSRVSIDSRSSYSSNANSAPRRATKNIFFVALLGAELALLE